MLLEWVYAWPFFRISRWRKPFFQVCLLFFFPSLTGSFSPCKEQSLKSNLPFLSKAHETDPVNAAIELKVLHWISATTYALPLSFCDWFKPFSCQKKLQFSLCWSWTP
jgi:hypothetical protein